MAMKPYKRAACVTGTYQDRNGEEKKRYVNVGTLFKYDDGGFALKLDSIPVGQGWNGFISFYDLEDKRENKGGGGSNQPEPGARESFAADLDDTIPFIEAGDR